MSWKEAIRDPSWTRLQGGLRRRLQRGAKYLRQARRGRSASPNFAAFLVGCQRSGTTMTVAVFERSAETWVYGEDHPAAFRNYRLRSDECVERLVRRSFVSTVLFKPICDSQLTDRLLDRHPGSRAIWIYRAYQDVANSLVRKFGDHQKGVVQGIHDRDWTRIGWRGERLPEDLIELSTQLWRPEMPPEEAAAVMWLIRNRFFFDLGLSQDERVLLVRYEDLVTDPTRGFGRIFDFLNMPFDPAIVADVHASSIAKSAFPSIDPRVSSLCDELADRMATAYQEQGSVTPAPFEGERLNHSSSAFPKSPSSSSA
jgi:hypothetical protein